MPLRQVSGHATQNGRSNEVLVAAGLAANKPVKEAVLKTCQQGGSEAASGEKRMGCGLSYGTGSTFSKRSQWAANGAQGGSSGGGTGLGKREALEDRTFAVYKNFSAIAIGTHQYSSIVYLFVCQARLAVDDFEKLGQESNESVEAP